MADSDSVEKGVVVLNVLDTLLIFLHEGSSALLNFLVQFFDLPSRLRGAVEELSNLVNGLDLGNVILEFR